VTGANGAAAPGTRPPLDGESQVTGGPPGNARAAGLWARVDHFDDIVDHHLDRIRGIPALDRLFYAASEAGNFSVLWYLIALTRAAVSPRRRGELVRMAVCLGIESVVVNQGLKRLVHRPRPVHDQQRPHALRTPSTSSFPSGHASSALLAAALLAQHDRRGRPLWYALATVVGLSRAYVRVHHASDVLAGAAVGVAFGRVARRWPVRRAG
jgi:undecaprenyl-diphosphatase